jgi:NAD dependent epimerase/dehydratase
MSIDLTKARALVTGSGGFIGSHLTEALLKRGCDVTAMIRYTSRSDWGNLEFLPADARSALKVVAGSVEDPYFVSKHVRQKDVVFHLAALIGIPYSYVAPHSYLDTNIRGTINVLEAARDHGVARVVHTSTSEVYGTAKYTPIDESHPLQPQSPYSASKIGADMIAESFWRSFGTPVAIVRPFNTFGPRQSARAVIPTIISQALGKNPEIRLGALAPIRDLTFVKDTVEGFIAAAQAEVAVGQVTNLGAGQGISIGDLAARILEMLQCAKPITADSSRIRPELSEVFRLVADTRKAQTTLQWKPRYSLTEGLRETIDFISEHRHLFNVDRYTI